MLMIMATINWVLMRMDFRIYYRSSRKVFYIGSKQYSDQL